MRMYWKKRKRKMLIHVKKSKKKKMAKMTTKTIMKKMTRMKKKTKKTLMKNQIKIQHKCNNRILNDKSVDLKRRLRFCIKLLYKRNIKIIYAFITFLILFFHYVYYCDTSR